MSDWRDAVARMQQQALNGHKGPFLRCPHCQEHRLEKLRPHGSGVVYCLSCQAQFEVKEPHGLS